MTIEGLSEFDIMFFIVDAVTGDAVISANKILPTMKEADSPDFPESPNTMDATIVSLNVNRTC